MIREVEKKALLLKVIPDQFLSNTDYYKVKSGNKVYDVTVMVNGNLNCTCTHGSLYAGTDKMCSHLLAVLHHRLKRLEENGK